MTQIDVVSFKCACGKRLQARVEQAGRVYACPGCGAPVAVPSLRPTNVAAPAAPVEQGEARAAASPTFAPFARVPATVPELLFYVGLSWVVIVLASLVLVPFGTIPQLVALVCVLFGTLAAAQQAWLILYARQAVLSRKRVPLLWGTVTLIAWEPTEGVLILKNKAVHFSDDDLNDGVGGVRFLYPILGEELALRVPLETQTLHFADQNVLTREYLHLSVRGTMKWRIVDIRKFYLLVSRELRSTSEPTQTLQSVGAIDHDDGRGGSARLINATIEWLRALAEEQTRIVVSRVRSGLLIADRIAAEVPEVRAAEANVGDATSGLAGSIHEVIATSLGRYGIAVDDVSLQEVRLPAEIVAQCVEACRTAYLPLIATRQASARKAELAAEAEILGRDAVAAREIVSNAPAYALRDFLTEFVTQKSAGGAAVAAQVAAAALTDAAPPAGALPEAGPRQPSSASSS